MTPKGMRRKRAPHLPNTWGQAAARYFAMHESFDLHDKASWNSQILATSFMGPWQGFYRFQVHGRTFPPDLSMAGHVPHHLLKVSFPLESFPLQSGGCGGSRETSHQSQNISQACFPQKKSGRLHWSQAAAHYFATHASFDLHDKASWNSQILATSFMGPWQGFYRFQVHGRTFPPDLSMAGHVPHHLLKISFPLGGFLPRLPST